MLRLLTILLLLIGFRGQAAVTTADMMIMPDRDARAILTIGALSNIVAGSHGLLLYAGATGSTWARTYIDASVDSTLFPSPVTVGGVSYNGSSTNWIRMDSATNLSNEYVDIELPGNAGSTVTNLLIAGFMKWCVTNTTGSIVAFDEIIIYDSYLSSFSVMQFNAQANQGALNILAHTSVLGITTPTITSGGTGYTVNDILTVTGGTFGTGSGTTADLKVNTVNGSGVITSISVNTVGGYSTAPSSPNAVTGGTGTGASIGLSLTGPSTFAGIITISPCKNYFVVLFRDALVGRACVKVYDPSNWSLVGESIGNAIVSNTYLVQWPVGYIGNLPQNVYHGPTFMKFGATSDDYANIVPSSTNSFNSVIAGQIIVR